MNLIARETSFHAESLRFPSMTGGCVVRAEGKTLDDESPGAARAAAKPPRMNAAERRVAWLAARARTARFHAACGGAVDAAVYRPVPRQPGGRTGVMSGKGATSWQRNIGSLRHV